MNKKLGAYQLIRVLGRGGMGTVYEAHDAKLERRVAIKQLSDHVSHDPNIKKRFLREARSAAGLNHANIVQVYAIEEDNTVSFIVMELVEGESLAALLKREGRLPAAYAAGILRDVAQGLAAAHQKGIIHRDIKPGNIILTTQGAVKLADFGIAATLGVGDKLTATGQLVGTPGYLSPEACRGEAVDHRADIFALGVVFYEILSGISPFESESPVDMLQKIAEARVPDIDSLVTLDESCKAILNGMIQRDPGARFSDCHVLIDRLNAYLATQKEADRTVQVAAPRVMPVSPTIERPRLPRSLLACAALVALALLTWLAWPTQKASQNEIKHPTGTEAFANGSDSSDDGGVPTGASLGVGSGQTGPEVTDPGGDTGGVASEAIAGSFSSGASPLREEVAGADTSPDEDPDILEGQKAPDPTGSAQPISPGNKKGVLSEPTPSEAAVMNHPSPAPRENSAKAGPALARTSQGPHAGPFRVAIEVRGDQAITPFLADEIEGLLPEQDYQRIHNSKGADLMISVSVEVDRVREINGEYLQEGWLRIEGRRNTGPANLGLNWFRPIEWGDMNQKSAVNQVLSGFQVHLKQRLSEQKAPDQEMTAIAIHADGDWEYLSSVENHLAALLEENAVSLIYGMGTGAQPLDLAGVTSLAQSGADYVLHLQATTLTSREGDETLYRVTFSWRCYDGAKEEWRSPKAERKTVPFTRLNLDKKAKKEAAGIYKTLLRGYKIF